MTAKRSFIHQFFFEVGAMGLFVKELMGILLSGGLSFKLFLEQINLVVFRSIGTILFTGLFVGAILILQFHMMLEKYDASVLIGGLTTSATIREIGPLIISFLLAGKIGAYTTAELGTMKVTEQIDAVRCLGTNPLEYLILPRFLAIIFSATLLLFFGLLVGVIGSIAVADYLYNINFLRYIETIPRFANFWTLFGGIAKSFIYGSIVATVCTYKGISTTGGAKGVGRAVTECSIYTNLLIVLANWFSSFFLNQLQLVLKWLTGSY